MSLPNGWVDNYMNHGQFDPSDDYIDISADLRLIEDDCQMKDIPNFEGVYSIDPLGRVYDWRINKYLSPIVSSTGYLVVNLKDHGYYEQQYIHRLVAEAFLPNPYENIRDQVNHIDENKWNNHLTNLEWCTKSYNNSYGTARQRSALAQSKPIIGIDPDGNTYEFTSQSEASIQTRIPAANIWKVMNGQRPHAGHWKWMYKDI